jgi:hypothetical protein
VMRAELVPAVVLVMTGAVGAEGRSATEGPDADAGTAAGDGVGVGAVLGNAGVEAARGCGVLMEGLAGTVVCVVVVGAVLLARAALALALAAVRSARRAAWDSWTRALCDAVEALGRVVAFGFVVAEADPPPPGPLLSEPSESEPLESEKLKVVGVVVGVRSTASALVDRAGLRNVATRPNTRTSTTTTVPANMMRERLSGRLESPTSQCHHWANPSARLLAAPFTESPLFRYVHSACDLPHRLAHSQRPDDLRRCPQATSAP